jgi:thiol:disulfide interchange protein
LYDCIGINSADALAMSQNGIESQPPRDRHNPIWVLFLLMAAVLSVRQWLGPRDRVPWGYDLSAAKLTAQRDHKPVLAYFTTEGCGPCQNMGRNVWSDAKVAEAARAYVPVKINIDVWPELREKYQVRAIPTMAVLDERGTVVRSMTGACDAGEMIAWLSR